MAGHWSDLLGRKRLYLLGALLAGAFGFVYFTLMNTAVPAWMFVAIVLCYVPRDLMYGPIGGVDRGMFPRPATL
jgi:MFS family permease